MCQVYHSNASTNSHIREIIQKSDLPNVELARSISPETVKELSKVNSSVCVTHIIKRRK